jgi:hypothetical protein
MVGERYQDSLSTFNARADSIATKPAFRDAWRKGQRCLVITNGVPAVTTYEFYAALLGVLQLIVSGLGFIVVTWTLRVLVRSIDAQASAGVAARQLEFDKVVLAYPCLHKYFYQGHDIDRDDPNYARAMAATQLLANYFDGYFQQQGMYRLMWPGHMWKNYIQDHVAKSPVLRRYVTENQTWFSPEFVQMCQLIGQRAITPN